jgi:deoxyribonuclease-4
MPKLGFHVSLLKKSVAHSISYFHKLCNISAFQLFLKSPKQKGAINIKEDEYIKSKKYIEDNDLFVVSHSPYIINIASSDEDTINSNIQYAVSEIDAISKLGGKGSVYHVGKSVKLSKEDGFNYMCNFIKKVLDILIERQTTGYFILETGAGCGTELCTKIEDLGKMYHQLNPEQKEKIMFCIDTCHIFSAGYQIDTAEGSTAFIDLFEKSIGWDKVICIHLNDSKTKCGSCVDRHENFTKGFLTNERTDGVLHFLMHCKKLDIPLILETPVNDSDYGIIDIISERNNEIKLIQKWLK